MAEVEWKDDEDFETVDRLNTASYDKIDDENTKFIDEDFLNQFVSILNQIAMDPNDDNYISPPAGAFNQILEMYQIIPEDQKDNFLKSTNAIISLFICLRNSFSTTVCCNTLFTLNCMLLTSDFARKKAIYGEIEVLEDGIPTTKSFIHILLKVMRGPSIMPYACQTLKILIEKVPDCASYLIEHEPIMRILYSIQATQADPFKLASVLHLIIKFVQMTEASLTGDFEPIMNLFMTTNINYIFIVDASLQLFSILISTEDSKSDYYITDDVFMRLNYLLDQIPKVDKECQLLGHIIEIYNQLYVHYHQHRNFNTEYYFQMMDKILAISESVYLAKIRSRLFFFFSNLIQDEGMAAAIFNKGFIMFFVSLTDDMTMIEKETFFTLIANGILTLKERMFENIENIGDILSDMLAFAPNAFNKKFHISFLKVLQFIANFFPQMLEVFDESDMECYFDSLPDDTEFIAISGSEDLMNTVHSLLFDE